MQLRSILDKKQPLQERLKKHMGALAMGAIGFILGLIFLIRFILSIN